MKSQFYAEKQKLANIKKNWQKKHILPLRAGLHCAYKISKLFTLVRRGCLHYTVQNGAYERNSLTAYFVGGHNIMLNVIG